MVHDSDSEELGETSLAGALHEVSNALTVVVGWLQRTKLSLPPGEARDAVEVALRHAMLGHNVARRAIGARTESAEKIRSIAAIGQDAALAVTPEATRRNVKVSLDFQSDDELIKDADVALQILVNLLLNAIAFSPSDGTVTLRAYTSGSQVLFSVSDEGTGVPEAQRAGLFTTRDSMRPGGAGIGLPHSRELARSKGAELSLADSDAGACFELAWPTGNAPSSTLERTVHPDSIGGLRVLVVDDDAALRSLVEVGLESRGVHVTAARSLLELNEITTRGSTFDVAFVDLSPLGATPHDELANLRAAIPELRVVVMSGNVDADVDEGENVTAWVRKPFDLQEIYEVLARLKGS